MRDEELSVVAVLAQTVEEGGSGRVGPGGACEQCARGAPEPSPASEVAQDGVGVIG